MQNGNSGNNYTTEERDTNKRGYNSGNYISIGSFQVKPVYFYIAVAAAVMLLVAFVLSLLQAKLTLHFGLIAGILLLLANVRELLGYTYGQHNSTALLNCIVGASLFFAWLTAFGALFWLPALALIAVAIPLVMGRTSVYSTYVQFGRTAFNSIRRAIGR